MTIVNPTAEAVALITNAARQHTMSEYNRVFGKPSRQAVQDLMRKKFPRRDAQEQMERSPRRLLGESMQNYGKRRLRNEPSYPTEAEMAAADNIVVKPKFSSEPREPREPSFRLSDENVLKLCRMSNAEFQRVLGGSWGSNWAANARLLIGAREEREAKEQRRDPFVRELDLD